jgi:hypothetical protein
MQAVRRPGRERERKGRARLYKRGPGLGPPRPAVEIVCSSRPNLDAARVSRGRSHSRRRSERPTPKNARLCGPSVASGTLSLAPLSSSMIPFAKASSAGEPSLLLPCWRRRACIPARTQRRAPRHSRAPARAGSLLANRDPANGGSDRFVRTLDRLTNLADGLGDGLARGLHAQLELFLVRRGGCGPPLARVSGSASPSYKP